MDSFYWFEIVFKDNNGTKKRPIVTFLYNNQAFSFEVLGIYSEKDKYKINPYYKDFMYKFRIGKVQI